MYNKHEKRHEKRTTKRQRKTNKRGEKTRRTATKRKDETSQAKTRKARKKTSKEGRKKKKKEKQIDKWDKWMNKQRKQARKQGSKKATKKEERTEKRRKTTTIMLIIWRTCRIWLRTEWSVQIEHISTSMMYQNGQCIKLTDHERWQLSALDLGAFFQMHYFVRVTLHNWQISRAGLIQIRGCRADAHRASWRKASRFWEVSWEIPGFFGVEKMEEMWWRPDMMV